MTELCTTIGDGRQAGVATVEHLLAAFLGLGIDNVLVEIDGPEVPIMDGSSAAFVDMIDAAGIETLSPPRRYIRILKPVRVSFGDAFCELRPHELGLRLDVDIDFPSAAIGRQARAADLPAKPFVATSPGLARSVFWPMWNGSSKPALRAAHRSKIRLPWKVIASSIPKVCATR